MDGGQRSRRRRGRRGGQNRPNDDAAGRAPGTPPGPPGPPRADFPAPPEGDDDANRAPRRRLDTRRIRHGGEVAPEHENGGGAGRIHRRPPPERPQREGRGGARNDGRSRDRGPRERERDLRPRTYEAPVPQDEHSVELGARFREAQAALRDAQKTLDKRQAEQGDAPQWLTEELTAAEQRFAEAATAWSEHLATTGRKVVRR